LQPKYKQQIQNCTCIGCCCTHLVWSKH